MAGYKGKRAAAKAARGGGAKARAPVTGRRITRRQQLGYDVPVGRTTGGRVVYGLPSEALKTQTAAQLETYYKEKGIAPPASVQAQLAAKKEAEATKAVRRAKLISESPTAKYERKLAESKAAAERQAIISAEVTIPTGVPTAPIAPSVLRGQTRAERYAGLYAAGERGAISSMFGSEIYGEIEKLKPSERKVVEAMSPLQMEAFLKKATKEEKELLFGKDVLVIPGKRKGVPTGTLLYRYKRPEGGEELVLQKELRLMREAQVKAEKERAKALELPFYKPERIKEEAIIKKEKAKAWWEKKERGVPIYQALGKLPPFPKYEETAWSKLYRGPGGRGIYGGIRELYEYPRREPRRAALEFGAWYGVGLGLPPALKWIGKGIKKVPGVPTLIRYAGKIPKTPAFTFGVTGAVVSKGLKVIPRPRPKKFIFKVPKLTAPQIAEYGIGAGLVGAYVYPKGLEVMAAPTPEAKGAVVGKALGYELAPMGLGALTYYKGVPKVTDWFKTIGKKKIEPPIPYKTLIGKEPIPTAPLREHRGLFLRPKKEWRLPGEKRFGVWKAIEDPWAKRTVVRGAEAQKYELPGAFVAPFISPHFLRVQPGAYPMFGLGLPRGLGKPTALRIYPFGLKEIPKGVPKKEFLMEKALKGWAYLPLTKTEVQAIETPATPLYMTGKRFWFKFGGRRVSVHEYDVDMFKVPKKYRGKPITYGKVMKEYEKSMESYYKPYKSPLVSPYGLYYKAPTKGLPYYYKAPDKYYPYPYKAPKPYYKPKPDKYYPYPYDKLPYDVIKKYKPYKYKPGKELFTYYTKEERRRIPPPTTGFEFFERKRKPSKRRRRKELFEYWEMAKYTPTLYGLALGVARKKEPKAFKLWAPMEIRLPVAGKIPLGWLR